MMEDCVNGVLEEEQISNKDEYIERICRSAENKSLYIYGAGMIAEEVYFALKERNQGIKAFCVTERAGNKTLIDKVPVVKFAELDNGVKQEALFVIATKKKNEDSIVKNLVGNGVRSYIRPLVNMENILGVGELRSNSPNVEITTRIGCRVNCKYCPQELIGKVYREDPKRDTVMSMDTYMKCLDKLPKETIITFSGFSEPFLNPNCIHMLQYAVQQGYRLTLNTTLVGLKMHDAEILADLPIEHMILHTPDSREYANIPVTEEYKRILDMLLDVKMTDGRSLIKTANCQSSPKKEVLDLINGRVTFAYEPLQDIAGNVSATDVAMNINLEGSIMCSQSKELNRNVLLPDGSLVLCCLDYGLKHVLGNLLQESYEQIVNGKELNRVKERMKNGGEVLCRHCCIACQTG